MLQFGEPESSIETILILLIDDDVVDKVLPKLAPWLLLLEDLLQLILIRVLLQGLSVDLQCIGRHNLLQVERTDLYDLCWYGCHIWAIQFLFIEERKVTQQFSITYYTIMYTLYPTHRSRHNFLSRLCWIVGWGGTHYSHPSCSIWLVWLPLWGRYEWYTLDWVQYPASRWGFDWGRSSWCTWWRSEPAGPGWTWRIQVASPRTTTSYSSALSSSPWCTPRRCSSLGWWDHSSRSLWWMLYVSSCTTTRSHRMHHPLPTKLFLSLNHFIISIPTTWSSYTRSVHRCRPSRSHWWWYRRHHLGHPTGTHTASSRMSWCTGAYIDPRTHAYPYTTIRTWCPNVWHQLQNLNDIWDLLAYLSCSEMRGSLQKQFQLLRLHNETCLFILLLPLIQFFLLLLS